jgi:hypothetical protein
MSDDDLTQRLADRLAVTDVVVRYFELVDAKRWEHMHEVFTEDTTTRWTADTLVEGRDSIVAAMQHMIGSDEIVTYHHVASMAPVVDGDSAEVVARVRAMHYGVGPRAGKFYESLGIQPTRLVRTPEGGALAIHEWQIAVKLGDQRRLFLPRSPRASHYRPQPGLDSRSRPHPFLRRRLVEVAAEDLLVAERKLRGGQRAQRQLPAR